MQEWIIFAISEIIARYYLKKPDQAELIRIKYPSLKCLFSIFLNQLCEIFHLTRSYKVVSIHFELTNHCNLKCNMCPVNRDMIREKGFMDFALFKKIVDGNLKLSYVALHNWGEPLLHPNIIDMIKYCTTREIKTMLYTNGLLLTTNMISDLLRSGLGRITVSLDGVGETYREIRGIAYEQIRENILKLIQLRDWQKKDLKIEISTVIFENTEDAVKRIKEEWSGLVDRIIFQPKFIRRENGRKSVCHELWRGNLIVLWNGTVVPCCIDSEGKLNMGNAWQQGISEIWNGDKMRAIRKKHSKGKFPNICNACCEYTTDITSPRFS